MYIPSHFKFDDPEQAYAVIRQNSFATLVSQLDRQTLASHVPLFLDRDKSKFGTLRGHLALPNEHATHIQSGEEMLAIFHGPHAYISPSDYVSGNLVPTWNYVAVHAYGRPRVMAGDELVSHLNELVGAYEQHLPEPWTANRLPEGLLEKLSRGVVGFEISIERIDAKAKLSQNRSAEDRAAAIRALLERGDAQSVAIAELMQQLPG